MNTPQQAPLKIQSPLLTSRRLTIISLGVLLFVGFAALSQYYDETGFNRLSSRQHLELAKDLMTQHGGIDDPTFPDEDLARANRHLHAIPATASEHTEAASLLARIQGVQKARAAIDPRQASWERYQHNVQGVAHDFFTCSTSTTNKPIVSFDNGRYWWWDDGRCAAREQKKRDEDAQLSSYWSTTIRVDTDMDSFWLNNEERTCQTYPDDKGRVSVVACNATGSHRDHNIPVKFWGGVDRNTVSDWKCRRESDNFVCRAID